ncbi:MAG: beta strand repeat-containing protein, partial [Microbacteriaceae bacterium]
PFDLSVTDGTVNISGGLTMFTPGEMRVSLENSTVNVSDLFLQAANFVLPEAPPVAPGTFNVTGGLGLFSNLDFLTYANFNVPFDTSFSWAGDFQTGDFTGGFNLFVDAVGSITMGDIEGNEVGLFAGTSVTTGSVSASESIEMEALGAISTGSLVAGDVVDISAGGAVNVASASAGLILPSSNPEAEFNVGLRSLTSITAGDLSAKASIGVSSPGSISVGNITTGDLGIGFLALAGTGLNTGAIDTTASVGGGRTYLANFSMEALGGEIANEFDPAPILAAMPVAINGPATINGSVSTGTIQASALGSLAINGVTTATGTSVLVGGQSLTTGNLTAGNQAIFASGGALTLGNVDVGIALTGQGPGKLAIGSTAGPVNTGTLSAAGDLGVQTGGSITTGSLRGRDVLLLAGGAVATGAINAGLATQPGRLYIGNFAMAAPTANVFSNFAALPIFGSDPLASGGPISIAGTVNTGSFRAASGGDFTIGTPSTTPGSPTTGGTVTAGREVELVAGGALQFGDMTSGTYLDFEGTGTLTGGNLTASESIGAQAVGSVILGNLSGGVVNPVPSEDDFSVGVVSTGGSTTVGHVAARDDIGILAGGGNLTTGDLTGGGDVLLLARNAVSVGSITSAAAGRTYIANSSLISLGGPLDSDNFDAAPIFAAAPVAVNGAITLGGPLSSGTLTAAATGNFTAGNLTLGQRLTIGRAATAQVNGSWIAPTISVASQRLQFGTEGTNIGIGGSQTTSLSLRALASQQTAVLGGTTRGEGYTLTQADFGRIRTSNLTIQVDQQGVSSSARDLEIRDLTLNGSGMSGRLSMVSIGTPGSARITGDLVLQQAGAEDRLTVSGGQRLEIVLPDASVAVTGTGGALAGSLTLSSNNLVAGTLDLLMQVMADPEAAGLADALATPASTTSNLDGYIRANSVSLISNANILLQNSGTARDFAGVTTGGGGLIIGRITPMSGSSSGGNTGGNTGGTTG